jgi:hypothetical protein
MPNPDLIEDDGFGGSLTFQQTKSPLPVFPKGG